MQMAVTSAVSTSNNVHFYIYHYFLMYHFSQSYRWK